MSKTRRGCKPRLPDLGTEAIISLKLTPIVWLGMQIVFGRVRRKTAPTDIERILNYHITVPPVLMSCPVMFAESSDARKTANAAASSDPEPLSL